MVIRFSGLLKTEVTGEWESDVDASNVAELLGKLINKYGPGFEKKVMADGKIRWNILIVVNGIFDLAHRHVKKRIGRKLK